MTVRHEMAEWRATSARSGTGETRRESNLSTSRLSRMSRASRATVCGAGGLFQHPARSIGMLVNKSLPYRQPHNLQIEPNRPMLNVIQVELNALFKRGVATPATDLRPPCDPGFHFMLEHI